MRLIAKKYGMYMTKLITLMDHMQKKCLNNAHHISGVHSVFELHMEFYKKCTLFSEAKLTNETNLRLY